MWCDCDLSNIIIIDSSLLQRVVTSHNLTSVAGTARSGPAPGICLARTKFLRWSQSVCRVEFPHISQFLLMLALRVQPVQRRTGINQLGYTWHNTGRYPSWQTEVGMINIQQGDRCESHQFCWQVSLAGFVLSAADSLINLSRVVTRCAGQTRLAAAGRQNKMRKLYWGPGRGGAGRAPVSHHVRGSTETRRQAAPRWPQHPSSPQCFLMVSSHCPRPH